MTKFAYTTPFLLSTTWSNMQSIDNESDENTFGKLNANTVSLALTAMCLTIYHV